MTRTAPASRPRLLLSVALWGAQALLALTLVGGGAWKLATPIATLGAQMPWMAEVSPAFLIATAVVDVLCGLGVLLPSLTRIQPRLAVVAALGVIALMGGAIVFHVQRGEAANTPFNFFVAALAAFVLWGRHRAAPIAPRA